ncbi:hypothetical protein LEP1GSC175_1411 [Leptospira santarosai str. HAI821]|nr:hypothetical protein LEP1GSC175_1411 [Leptospira santarosai str. HAI821]
MKDFLYHSFQEVLLKILLKILLYPSKTLGLHHSYQFPSSSIVSF